MDSITVPAILAKQNGSRLLITKMKAGDLKKYTTINRYDASKKPGDPDQGYQRPEEAPRVKKFARWLEQELAADRKVRMPTAILLSARGSDVTLSAEGTITLSKDKRLFLIDGQHRRGGFEYAIMQKGLTEFADYEVVVVIMLDLDKIDEMRQFSVVNGTQKSVRTDLVNMILTQLAETEDEDIFKSPELSKIVVSRVVIALNDDPTGPWHDQIVMPDGKMYSKEDIAAHPELRHRRVIRATSMMQSLRPIDSYLHEFGFADEESLDARVRVVRDAVDAYWRAIRELMPVCFKYADNYVLQKTPGIFALHQLGLRVMRDMHIGHRKFTQEQFKQVLVDCDELRNPDYWKVAEKDEPGTGGDATRYGSMKGFSELAALLYQSYKG